MIANGQLSRRGFVKGVAAGAAGAAVVGTAGLAMAEDAETAGGATADWLGEAPDVDEADVVETVDCDVAIAGAGNAGCMCALRAAEGGASVVVIDRMAMSVTERSFLGAVGTRWQEETGYAVDRNEIANDLVRYSSGWAKQPLINLWADHSAEALGYIDAMLEAEGAGIMLEYGMPDVSSYDTWPTNHFPMANRGQADGRIYSGLLDLEIARATGLGAEFRYETELVKVERVDGRVTGLIAQNADGGYIRLNAAKGVVLCTGGYAGNKEMLDALQPWLNGIVTTKLATGTSIGSGIKAGLWVGAARQSQPTSMLFDRGMIPAGGRAGEPFEGTIWSGCSQPTLRVNRRGERFCNESMPYDFTCHASGSGSDGTWFQIMDANFPEDAKSYDTMGCSRLVAGPGTGWSADGNATGSMDGTVAKIEEYVESGLIQKADTLEELAGKLGIPADALAATVERYNELCDAGYDEDFGKEASRLRPCRQAPFYGIQVGAWLLCTLDGLRIDTNFRVLDTEGAPIEGLYAIGNDAGDYFAHNYPELVVGAAVGRTVTFGYLLGDQLAKA